MPENERRKGQHLCWMDRYEIQKGLRKHKSFVEIAKIIGSAPQTVSKEIRNHRYCKKHDSSKFGPSRCKYRDTCHRRNVCNKKKGHKCRSCNKLCSDFIDYPCKVADKAPYVCNACHKSKYCLFDKYLYNADYA